MSLLVELVIFIAMILIIAKLIEVFFNKAIQKYIEEKHKDVKTSDELLEEPIYNKRNGNGQ